MARDISYEAPRKAEETASELVSSLIANAEIPESVGEKELRIAAWLIILVIVFGISAVTFLYHLYIGLNAFREGREKAKKKRIVYLVLAAVSGVSSVAVLCISVASIFKGDETGSQVGIATLLLESCSLLNYLYLLYSAIKIRRLERETV